MPRDRRRHRLRVALGWLAGALAAVLLVAAALGYVAYRRLNGNITREDVGARLGLERPRPLGRAVNYLLIGSDTRQGAANARYGASYRDDPPHSDTVVLVHLSARHDKALLVSIPRDSLVRIPACRRADGTTTRPQRNKFNAAFTLGGPTCTIKTVESLTGVRIDHFAQVDFTGFKRMVDALGGVEVCLPEAVDDPESKLRLTAGRHIVAGETALAFVRARKTLGDGSDLGRIERQQQFMAAVVKKASSTGLLLNPPKLYGFLDAATRSLTTDKGLDLLGMRQLASTLRGLQAGKVTFVTVPIADADYRSRLGGTSVSAALWDDRRAADLWQAIRTDGPVPGASPPARPGALPVTVPPQRIRVQVLNGAGTPGLAARAAADLRRVGFRVVATGNADATYAVTIIRYGASRQESSQTLQAAVPTAQRQLDASLGPVLKLVVGPDWSGAQPVSVTTPPAARPPIKTMTAADDICD